MAKRKRVGTDARSEPPIGLKQQVAHGNNEAILADDDYPKQFRRIHAYKGNSEDEDPLDGTGDLDQSHPSVAAPIDSDDGASEDEIEAKDHAGSSTTSYSVQSETIEHVNELPNEDVATISFGALAKAQATLGNPQRTNHNRSAGRKSQSSQYEKDIEALERRAGKKDTRDFDRTSKHAPAELSSKKAVSRKRSAIPVHHPDIRDPRFERTSGSVNREQVRRNYAFLSTYRDGEIAELEAGLRKTKDANAREKMKKALLSLQSRKRTEESKEQQQEVLRTHRREEKEKVMKTGKKPFHLKKSQIKERALLERFKGLKEKQIDKAIEKRRRKVTAKERKGMPIERRE
ncbi:uncharacterized protein KY384_003750 [Bacidia gigantensis]|uniref:uncharacterized protein n=1 Tax=Bacidia gigantensis TaxID=2732470 RepID=UPI001D047A73|nr:uncharacterized protein KY384_003750 [Bacidia gigantensis]KAG8532113.1 hypothetical protein KY384_003750 [Bacidia gigantensis]